MICLYAFALGLYFVELVGKLLVGSLGQQADDDNHGKVEKEGGQQLVYVENCAGKGGTDEEFPDKDHGSSRNHSGDGAELVGASPEEGAEHHRAEGGSEARPRKGNDTENRAVGISRKEDGDYRNDHNRNSRKQHGLFNRQLDAEAFLNKVFGNTRGGGKELGIGGGHGGGENTRKDYSARKGRNIAVFTQEFGDVHNDAFGGGIVGIAWHDSVFHERKSDNSDKNGNSHSNGHPNRGDAAGKLKLFLVSDCHKAEKNVGHSEITESPGKGGGNRQGIVISGHALGHVVALKNIEVSRKLGNVGENLVESADETLSEAEHDKQGNRHDYALYKIGEGGGEKSARRAVKNDNRGAYYHGGHVIHSEKGGKEFSAGAKSRRGVGNEENHYHQRRNAGQHLFTVAETAGKEIGNGEGVDAVAVNAKSFGHEKPVEIGSYCKTHRRPKGLGHAGHKGKAGHSHKQPAAHVGGFGAHGRHKGAELTSAEEEVGGGFVFLADRETDGYHNRHIGQYGDQHYPVVCCEHFRHTLLKFLLTGKVYHTETQNTIQNRVQNKFCTLF